MVRRPTALFAALLSMLMVSSSVSATTCDLSCWLGHGHSDCHMHGRAVSGGASMPMSPTIDMDMNSSVPKHTTASTAPDDSTLMRVYMEMGSDASVNSMAADTSMNATRGLLMSLSPQPEMEESAMHHHSGTPSSCIHGACGQIASSSSPPSAAQAQPHFLQGVSVHIGSIVGPRPDMQWIRIESPPPEILSAESLLTVLLI